jgi:beta-lactamase class D
MDRRHFISTLLTGSVAAPFLMRGRLAFAAATLAPQTCTVVEDLADGSSVLREGETGMRFSPCSTFKVAIAVMGFDAGILTDPRHPIMEYRPEYAAEFDAAKKTTDPTIWLKDSIVWYSQQTTKKLGMERFHDYVRRFDYGNQDVSGNPSKNDGLTQAWLMTSLTVSASEQANFVRRLLDRQLGVSDRAYDMTIATMPVFQTPGGWTVRGKTGSGWLKDGGGMIRKDRPQGWFVGWGEKAGRKLIFARLEISDGANDKPGGPRARDTFLAELDALS